MELNGLVNIRLIISRAISQNTKGCCFIYEGIADQILEQVDLLERYMLSIQDANGFDPLDSSNKKLPFWHEIKGLPKNYPTASERIDKKRLERPKFDLAEAIVIRKKDD